MNISEILTWDNFPLTSKLRNMDWPESWWQKCIFCIIIHVSGGVTCVCIDLVLIVVFGILEFLGSLISDAAKTFLSNFVGKLLAYTALFIFGFLTFWLIYTGEWHKLADFVGGAW